MPTPLTWSLAVEVGLNFSALWTDITTDVLADSVSPFVFRRGMGGNGPEDLVATPGTFTFALRNDPGNSAHLQSYYSPLHANCRAGFARGIPVRIRATYAPVNGGLPVTLWTGKLRSIDPDPGTYRQQRTHCIAYDCMQDLAGADLRAVAPQLAQTEVQLLQAIVAALPSTAQPVATSYDSALDVYPYAFDAYAGGVKADAAITDVAKSARGFVYPLADGTLHYENRHARPVKASSFLFTDLQLHGQGIVVPNNLSQVYNRVRVTLHPRTIDAAATTVLWAASTPYAVGPGETITVWGDYRVPTNTLKLIGGTAFVVPVAGTDYAGNTVATGGGSVVTGSLTVTATGFAASVQFQITNSSGATAYLVDGTGAPLLQLRGKGIYDDTAPTVESYIPESYGDLPLDLDLPFQADTAIGQDLADYVAAQNADIAHKADLIEFYPCTSSALLTQALTREIGDTLMASETVTGFSAEVVLAIQAIEMEYTRGPWLIVRYTLAPVISGAFLFDDAKFGVFDSADAVLGYA